MALPKTGVLPLILLCWLCNGASFADASKSVSLQPLRLELTTHLGDAQSFNQGDRIRLLISLHSAAYLLLLYQDAASNVIQLLPNQYQAAHQFQPGLFMPFPGKDQTFELVVQAPFGSDRVWAFASDQPMPRLPGTQLPNGLSLLQDSIDDLRIHIKRRSRTHFDEATLTILTHE